ncbi:MAG: A24 family peptidase [Polyangiaceae bacterium]
MIPFLVIATLVATVAAVTDLRSGHIPNRLTYGALSFGVGAHFARGAVCGDLSDGVTAGALAVAGAAACGAVPLFMFSRGAMGGGDVKLFAAIGALLQPLGGLEAETYAFVAAALVAPAQLAWQGKLARTLAHTALLITNPLRKAEDRRPVPESMCAWFRLGPAVLVGMVASLLVHGAPLVGSR